MKYGKILATAMIGLFAFAAIPSYAPAAKTTWNYAVWGPKRAFTKGIETAKKILEEAGGGDFEIKIHYGDAISPRKQIPDGIRIGAFEAGQFCSGYYPNKLPMHTVLELPFLLPTDIKVRATLEHNVLNHPALKRELAKRWNAMYFLPGLLPPYEFMGNKRIAGVKDMKGLRMRISGLNSKALIPFGAVPAMVTAPETYSAIDRGTIDVIGFPWTYAFGAYRLHEVSKYATEGVAMGGFSCYSVMNRDAWNALPDKIKRALPGAQEIATREMIKAYAVADKKWYPIFDKRLEIVQFPASERAKLAKGAGKIWNDWAKEWDGKGMPATEVLNFVKDQVRKAG